MFQHDLFAAAPAAASDAASPAPPLDLPAVLDRLSETCERPRYSFMVLQLIAQASARSGWAGPWIEANGRRLAYVPGCARVTDTLKGQIAGADALLFDGTVYYDDDMIRAGVGVKTGWRMGHVPMRGENGSVDALGDVAIGRRVFVHINNTNPVLIEDSPERAEIEAAGWTVGHDGLELSL